ncbi:MAG: bifunctional diguanylate cyclase/phosphodiesterase [Chromatiales bacterium]|nr:bifunctional diguanylate cyclase/phosphodiesterase [Chromatiales bacterium]
MLKRLLRPISLSAYAGIYIVLTLGLFTLLGWFTLEQLERADRDIRSVQREAAAEEFAQALQQAALRVRTEARGLAEWDEVRQQLAETTYYAYWRGYRMLKSDLLSGHTESAHLYDASGNGLVALGDTGMPRQIEGPNPRVTREDGALHLYVFEPVHGGSGGAVIGYVGLKKAFVPWFIESSRFHYLDEGSLAFSLPEGGQVELEELVSLTDYALRPNPQADAVRGVMETAVVRLALTISVLAVLFYVMQALLLALPLRRLTRDIDQMKHAARPMKMQHGDTFLPIAELEKVRHSLTEYQQKLSEVHSHLDEKNKTLWEMAHHDPLTGSYNRRAFDLDWAKLNDVISGRRIEVAFLLFDCNHFKAINDTYGHQVGDEVIRVLAQCITEGLRKGDRLYRLGGDEFATMLLNCGEQDARRVAERCAERVKAHDFSALGIKEPVRLSIGVSLSAGGDGASLDALHWQADIAMYRAKRPDSPPIQFYREDMGDGADALVSNQVASAVYDVLRHGRDIEMHYQPIIDTATGETEYFEALARIRHGEALLMPGSFLPVIEARRLELEFDAAVLDAILADLAAGLIPSGTGVAINLSGHSVVSPRVLDRLAAFASYRADYNLVLEVTETALIRQLEPATRNLRLAQEQGFRVALDDFGSGYSSLRYLGDMPVDVVKFDITMIEQMARGGERRRMMERIARLITEAGYRLVAEGIETEAVFESIRAAGFHAAQGYLIGRPGRPPQRGRVKGEG